MIGDILTRHDSNKDRDHQYGRVYDELLAGRTVKRLVEFGIATGGSLRAWAELFPDAEIIGVDIERRQHVNEGRIHSLWANQGDLPTLAAVAKEIGSVDVVIDDGSHEPHHQFATYLHLWPNVTQLYIVEDCPRFAVAMEPMFRVYDNSVPTNRHESVIAVRAK